MKIWTAPAALLAAFSERRAAVLSGQAPTGEFKTADLRHWLGFHTPAIGDGFLLKAGKRHELPMYTVDSKLQGGNRALQRPDARALQRWLDDGASLVLKNFESTHPVAFEIAMNIGAALQAVPHANLYATPAGEQTLERHSDPHAIVVVQLDGRKTWDVDQLGTVTLQPGDLLFVPAGAAHSARASSESLHLSVGLYPMSVLDLLALLPESVQAFPVRRSGELAGTDVIARVRALGTTVAALSDQAVLALLRQAVAKRTQHEWIPERLSTTPPDASDRWVLAPHTFVFVTTSASEITLTSRTGQLTFSGDVEKLSDLLRGPQQRIAWEDHDEVFTHLVTHQFLVPDVP